MKSNTDKLDKDRFYEITEVDEHEAWYSKLGSAYCCIGAIIQPAKSHGAFRVIRSSPTGYLSVSKDASHTLFMGSKLTLRPLNKKDQAKLQRVRDQFA